MFGGLYRVKAPVTIQGVDYQPGALVRMNAKTARSVAPSSLEPVSTLASENAPPAEPPPASKAEQEQEDDTSWR